MKSKRNIPTSQNRKTLWCNEHSHFLEIAKQAKAIVRDKPKLGMLFMVNPVLAMNEMEVEITESMRKRIKRAIRKSKLSEGNRSLYNKVKKGTYRIPWVDKVTFRKNKIADAIGR